MNRRLMLKMLAATSLNDLVGAAASSADDQVLELDCTELLAGMRNGSLRAEQVCTRFLRQYERQRSLNVLTWIDTSKVLSRARDIDRARDKGARLPALAGLPIVVKDNIDTVGFPTSAGTAFLKQNFPLRNAPVVERLLQQGAIVMGKANMHELGFGGTSSNPTYGFVRNPYKPDLIPGGSSGGSAAAIAARIVPAALGTDSGGSIRIPAAFCGIVGFRPSIYPRKLYSQRGIAAGLLDLDTIGPMGRCVTDVSLLHAAIVGERPMHPRSLENARVGLPRHPYWDDLDPEVERVCEAALMRLRDRGVVFVEMDLREFNETVRHIFSTLVSGARRDLEDFLRTLEPPVSLRGLTEHVASRDVRAALERLGSPAADLATARGAGRDVICAAYRSVLRKHDVPAVVFPTEVLLPLRIRAAGDDPDEMIDFNGRSVSKGWTLARNTFPACALGAPALSLPAGFSRDGLPVGLEFDGLPGSDSALLALGQAVEAAIGRVPAPPHIVPAINHEFIRPH